MSNIELECPVAGCNFGEAGGRYKTPPLPSGDAVQLLNIHNQNHTQAQGAAVGHGTGDAGRPKVEKVPRPTLSKGLSEDKFVHFERSANLRDDQQVRDQLLSCCTDELAEDLGNLFGDQ